MALILTPELIEQAYKKHAYILSDLNVGGIRYYNNEDLFTDIRFIYYKNVNGGWMLNQYDCTTKPGLSALKQGANAEGCGCLVEGQYINAWVSGYHKGVHDKAHRALIQCAPFLPVYRDHERDGVIHYDTEHIKKDGAGIDWHSTWVAVIDQEQTKAQGHTVVKEYSITGDYKYPNVGTWSLACNVGHLPSAHQSFMDIIDWSLAFHKTKWVTGTIFSINDFVV